MSFDPKKLFDTIDKDPSGVTLVIVSHDETCPAIHSGVGCNCEPDQEVVPEQEFVRRVALNRAQRRAKAKGGA